jgi:hypothetical protein
VKWIILFSGIHGAMQYTESWGMFWRNISPLFAWSKNKLSKKPSWNRSIFVLYSCLESWNGQLYNCLYTVVYYTHIRSALKPIRILNTVLTLLCT